MSDMMGSKATHLEDWAEKNHHGFLRFDYSGHGQSSGIFEKCNISDWVQDAYEIITEKTKGPIILIGSSMGGWISFLIYQILKQRVVGIITIAAAPDFTEDFFWFNFSDIQKSELLSSGKILLPSDYDEPYPITLKLIEDGRKNLGLFFEEEVPRGRPIFTHKSSRSFSPFVFVESIRVRERTTRWKEEPFR